MADSQKPLIRSTSEPRIDTPPDLRWIAGGRFSMGSDNHYPEEAPARLVEVDGFWIDERPVTNRQFAAFVAATGHITLAERPAAAEDYPDALPDMLAPASLVFTPPSHPVDLRNHHNWWSYIFGADWRHPLGPDSGIAGMEDHPVVHIASEDAEAYARWAGRRLPSEAEWEFAARGGLEDTEYAWGHSLTIDGRHMANTWQGQFPYENLTEDGYVRTSPVDAFPPNAHGLYDMIGNVWEWTADWWDGRGIPVKSCCVPKNPRGGEEAASYDPSQPDIRIPRRVLKGGSHLCAPSYCRRYRPAARHAQAIDSSTSHIGFRCVLRPSDLF